MAYWPFSCHTDIIQKLACWQRANLQIVPAPSSLLPLPYLLHLISYPLFSSLLECQQRVNAPAPLLPLVAPTPRPHPLHSWPGTIWPWSPPCIWDLLVSSWWARGRCGWSRKCAGMAIYVNACRACTHWGGLSTSSDWSSGHSYCPHFFIFPIILCWGRASIAQSLTQPA